MKLRKLTATFGCLEGATLEFGPGLTLLEAPNGSGKSTWCAFLRTMLYGLDTRQRDKKGAPADKNRYRPWNGSPMEGLMVCEHQGRVLEIRRTSGGGVPMGDFSALYQDTGLPVPVLTGENLGETLTGVSREVFDRSVYLRQTNLAVSQSQELEKRIAALVSSGEEDVSWSEADQRLRTWQHRRRFHKSGQLPQLEEEADGLRETLENTAQLRQELAQLQNRAAALRRQKEHWDSRLSVETDKYQTISQQRYAQAAAELDAAELRVQTLQAQLDSDQLRQDAEDLQDDMQEAREEMRSRRRLMIGFVVVILLLTLAAAAVYVIPWYVAPMVPNFPLDLPKLPLLFLAIPVAALWALVILFAIIKSICDRRSRKELRQFQALLEQLQQDHSAQDHALEEALQQRDQAQRFFDAVSQQGTGGPYLPPEAELCRESLHKAEQEIALLQGQLNALGDPVLLEAQLDGIQEKIDALEADYDALEIAQQALKEADSQLHARLSPQLSQRAGEYFARLTQGKYTQVGLTRDLEVTVREGDSLTDRPLALLSQGTADQLYLALRLAVSDLVLPTPQSCPLILDDALITFDDAHLGQALDLLLELSRDRQVLLFTCQKREAERLAGLDGVRVMGLGK